ncbi:cyclic nucleotide-binding domain-containing protein [Leptobacterium flavescens]|uniref:Cyclic nucleotide-binding domain-containing protein n=1 Tax=Leptobacterium flavescens TaxID=472055 RepID=A0A6P0UT37_9FLAO|nr:cyclic nucleotide-binding domain-containing protein [Leptobacterium flavescens]
MKTVEVKKGQILQHAGDTGSLVYEVVSGLLRSYTIDQKGKEHIFMFAPEGWIIADAVQTNEPCEFFIEALEDSTIIIRDKDLGQATSNIQAIAKRMLVLQRRVIMLMSYSGLQRYEHFIRTYPDLTQRVPQRMIASYLGITPEALSKAKGDKIRSSS